ncbi:hypothetical protein VP01_587g3 [Puccinia sorghi]|uniref:Uncharacterized protein n=1 Tax=Puccinia sorghi TaxID=27349 RepID=A0A0L6UHW6_9BASI|nr:hypothetical protein VP01_587g3 [Puccinia sorghi]
MTLSGLAFWHHRRMVQREDSPLIYIRAPRITFTRPSLWEPWNDARVPLVCLVELFRMSLADFHWLSDELRDELAQDPLG